MLIPVRLFPRHISFSKQALVHRLHFLHPPEDAHGLPVTRKSQRRSMGIQKSKVIWVGPIHSQLRYRALQVCVEALCEKIYADTLADVARAFAVFQQIARMQDTSTSQTLDTASMRPSLWPPVANSLSLWNLPAGTLRALADGRDANQLLLLLSPPCGILLRAHMCSAGNHVPCLHLPLGGASVPATRQGSDSGPFFLHFTQSNINFYD